jgi:bacteriocin biosynthesis cyclodehydratase domain-containing protein
MNDKTFKAIEYAEIPLPAKPRLVPWVTWIDLGDGRLQFRAAGYAFTLQSQLFIEVFQTIRPLLDGHHTIKQISSSGGEDIRPTTVTFLLKILRAHGLLQEGDVPKSLSPTDLSENDPELRFLSHFEPDSLGLLVSLLGARIGVVGAKRLKSFIQNAIHDAGIKQIIDFGFLHSAEGQQTNSKGDLEGALQGVDFLVACQESPGFTFFETINQACLATGTRWIHVAIEGTTALLGPTIIPNQTACYVCYESRVNSNLRDLDNYLAYKNKMSHGAETVDEGFFGPLWSLLASHVAIEVTRIVSGFASPETIGRFYLIDQMSPEAVGHNVLRVPRCSACYSREPMREPWDRGIIK